MIAPFLLRRLKQQVAQDLPEKTVQTLYCELTEPQRNAYERVRSAYRNTILEKIEDGSLAQNRFLVLRGLTHLRQIACHPALTEPDYTEESGKFESLCYKLEEILEEGHKVLIFSQFVRHLQLLKSWLDTKKIAYAYLDGQTKDRVGQVDRFEKNPSIQVFLLS
jgi:SNF2 family DNA or RNA helicase